MSRFKELSLAVQRLEDVLKNAYVGMVPCLEAGQFDSLTEKWESEVCNTLKEIRLLKSKALLVKATLQKDSIPDNDLSDTSLVGSLCGSMGGALRWRWALKTLAMCRAHKEVYEDKENRKEECLILDELSDKLFKHLQKLDLLEELEMQKNIELSNAQDEWRSYGEEYGVKSKVNYMGKKRDESTPEALNLMMRKVEIMKTISNRLLTSSHKYDWIHDPKGFLDILHKLRRDDITPETFV